MKNKFLKISAIAAISVSAALIFGISGCNADKTDKDVKTSGKLYAMGAISCSNLTLKSSSYPDSLGVRPPNRETSSSEENSILVLEKISFY